MSKEILVYGAGGFAREVKDVVDANETVDPGIRCLGFVDDAPQNRGHLLNELPVWGGEEVISDFRSRAQFLIGIGNSAARKKVAEKISRYGGAFATIVHPTVVRTKYIQIGEGTIIAAGVILTNQIVVGRHVILNLGVTVGHDCVLEDFVTVSPGAFVSGNVYIGEGTEVGTGSSIIQGIRIGRWSVIGAGAVVTKNIPDNCTAVGMPARVIKTREDGWHLE